MTGKERAKLRSMANTIQPIFQIGKGGVGEAMLEQLKRELGIERSIMLTTQEGCGDVVIRGGVNEAVKRLSRLFEPYLWERNQ